MMQRNKVHAVLAVLCVATGVLASEAREPVGHGESRFIGEVTIIPKNYMGFWRIASRQVVSDHMTDIVTMRGPLIVGSCVQVDMRQQKVLKIETLRQDEC